MILGLEIGMLIAGIMALAQGKLTLSKKQVVEGVAARLAGVVLILPVPLAFTACFVLGYMRAAQRLSVTSPDFQLQATLLELGIVV
jgi:hypothetical protein